MTRYLIIISRPGGDLLSRALRQSTIGADAFDGRVREGIGSGFVAEPPGRLMMIVSKLEFLDGH